MANRTDEEIWADFNKMEPPTDKILGIARPSLELELLMDIREYLKKIHNDLKK